MLPSAAAELPPLDVQAADFEFFAHGQPPSASTVGWAPAPAVTSPSPAVSLPVVPDVGPGGAAFELELAASAVLDTAVPGSTTLDAELFRRPFLAAAVPTFSDVANVGAGARPLTPELKPARARAAPYNLSALFPKAVLRSDPEAWKRHRSAMRGMSKEEEKLVQDMRRKELACVYAERARKRRLVQKRESVVVQKQLKSDNDALRAENKSLRHQVRALQDVLLKMGERK